MTPQFNEDLNILKAKLASLKTVWEGKPSVLELKQANYNWKQMEWWAFYFEYLCYKVLLSDFQHPGDHFDSVTFDLRRNVNWDLKAKAIKSDDHRAILNDVRAMKQSIAQNGGEHGVIIALCDVEYNDIDRSFQKWHTELKGDLSTYEIERKARTSISRYRKTKAVLTEILFLRFTCADLELLSTMKQGRNSNGKPRPEKYMIDLENIGNLQVGHIAF